MEKRRFQRNIVSLKAVLISGDVHCPSVIENISLKGVYAVASPAGASVNFVPGSPVELQFEFPSGKRHHLKCIIQWCYKTPPHELTSSIGMEIIDAPASYSEMFASMK